MAPQKLLYCYIVLYLYETLNALKFSVHVDHYNMTAEISSQYTFNQYRLSFNLKMNTISK